MQALAFLSTCISVCVLYILRSTITTNKKKLENHTPSISRLLLCFLVMLAQLARRAVIRVQPTLTLQPARRPFPWLSQPPPSTSSLHPPRIAKRMTTHALYTASMTSSKSPTFQMIQLDTPSCPTAYHPAGRACDSSSHLHGQRGLSKQ